MAYNFTEIEEKWRRHWQDQGTFAAANDSSKEKYYVLDMFPYPSGAGLHVGHPLGYIASDIVARYKRNRGYNVLHPMGFDAFGLPAEQYAIQTGQHPAATTDQNIARYKEQLKNIGFSFDWDREVRTSEPDFYRWTQWIFQQLFDHWYDTERAKARPIADLEFHLDHHGTEGLTAATDGELPVVSAEEWQQAPAQEREALLQRFRLAYQSEATVNWCPALGTVLANEEVKDGLSERGGHPVVRKKMLQWSLRITAYAERLLEGLDRIDWPEPVKEMQRNWIGRSTGCQLRFAVEGKPLQMEVFTTRVDTVYGVTFLTLAPEHEYVPLLTTAEQKAEVDAYLEKTKLRSERDRMADVKTVSGVFTGSYAINPFNQERVPIWVADYVLAGYGTGMVMAVPSSDERDHRFATHFGLDIIPVQEGRHTDITADDFDPKAGTMINSDFLNGMPVAEAVPAAIAKAVELGVGEARINYKLRDAVFSRQRYWGEPFPVYFEEGLPKMLPSNQLPLTLPEVDKYLPTEDGEPPLARATDWNYQGLPYEHSTMPGWAGSSWYQFRYMDPTNDQQLAGKAALDYWHSVDLYIGGSEHATGHLLYSRFWTKFLYDLGVVPTDEPFKKLVNQGMIQGRSAIIFRHKTTGNLISFDLVKFYESTETDYGVRVEDTTQHYIDISMVNQDGQVDLNKLKRWRPEFGDMEFANITEEDIKMSIKEETEILSTSPDGTEIGKIIGLKNQFTAYRQVEKMSKRLYNVVNPDDVVRDYGADCLRMYEMFLGPLEASKPWNTHGIDGVSKFLRKVHRLFFDDQGSLIVTDEPATPTELKVIHATIKKVTEDIDRLSFNTVVSALMVCANELTSLKCHKRQVLQPLAIVLSPYAPHLGEELWQALGGAGSVVYAPWPAFDEQHLVEDSHEYPITINGKVRTKLTFPVDMDPQAMKEAILADEVVAKWLEGKAPKKVIVVPKRLVNLVV